MSMAVCSTPNHVQQVWPIVTYCHLLWPLVASQVTMGDYGTMGDQLLLDWITQIYTHNQSTCHSYSIYMRHQLIPPPCLYNHHKGGGEKVFWITNNSVYKQIKTITTNKLQIKTNITILSDRFASFHISGQVLMFYGLYRSGAPSLPESLLHPSWSSLYQVSASSVTIWWIRSSQETHSWIVVWIILLWNRLYKGW